MTMSIIRLAEDGHTKGDIARLVGCSWQHVNFILRQTKTPQLVLAPLSQQQSDWLALEAAKSAVTLSAMARAMLIDAIEEEMNKCRKA